MKTLGLPFALGLVGTTFVASLASAHVRLVSPTPRYPSPTGRDTGVDIKDGPCGRLNGTRTTDMNRITVFQPGQTIAVTFNETIQHTGWFRIAFDDNGQDAFVTPLSTAMVQMGPTFTLPVLADNITDNMNGGMRTVMVTLPNVQCENCTLQLIQVMDTGTMTSWAADDIYYTCADIAIRGSGGGGAGGMGGTPSGGAGGGGMPSGGAGLGGVGGISGSGGSGIDTGGLGPGGLGGATSGGAGGATTGGTVSTGGVATGGVGTGGTPSAGAPATGGVPTGSGGTSAAGAATAGTTSNGAPAPPETAEDSGCHLAPGRTAGSSWPLAALALAAIGAVRRRRVSRSAAA
jgi:MYXO-CTERM domain-containing protein